MCDIFVYGGREPDETVFPRNYQDIRTILDEAPQHALGEMDDRKKVLKHGVVHEVAAALIGPGAQPLGGG